MGAMQGQNLGRLELSDKELALFYKGLYDASKGKELEVNVSEYLPKIQTMFRERMEKAAGQQKELGTKYVEDFLKKEGAKKTESGLAYLITEEGKGRIPKETDTVEVHYHGTLIDGTVFDSSRERGKTATFPLNRVIPGWTEGLQLLKEGGKATLVIPPELAYKESGVPPKIPGNATLVFEVELIKIADKDASGNDGHAHGGNSADMKKKLEAAMKKAKANAQKTKETAKKKTTQE